MAPASRSAVLATAALVTAAALLASGVFVASVFAQRNIRRVAAGSRAFVAPDKAIVPVVAANEEIDKALAWRTGQLVFDGDTVAEAVAEFNRYNVRKIEVTGTTLGGQKMIGRFRTNEPDAFARAAATLLNAQVKIGSDRIVLSQN